MRITSKGQVTIPIELREKYGLLPETEVRFEEDGRWVRLVKVGTPSGARGRLSRLTRGQVVVAGIRGTATGRRGTQLSTEEIMALTRGRPGR